MEILISSAFVQITFGLNQDCLNIFNNIFVMAAPYSYKQSKDVYKGDVNANTGSINLAWPSVKEGFYIDDDALNLAIHEFSHGILLEHINTTSNSPFFDKRRLKEYNVFAQQKLEKVRAGNNVVFRDYAGTNIMELFAVALETFFEKPSDFATHEPDLYKSICYLLNQNPIKEGSPLIYA
ncbi:MAG: hypothetical protein BM564_06470 [Bacteroidetes bacterium MedPE-SWsnd-G2]|nr:MAG: hypothetical protein BM564_06470 [Bacteroidetes bacterium MedPE-SWsnd-G2]